MHSNEQNNINELNTINNYLYTSDNKLLGKKTESHYIEDDSEEQYKNEIMEMLQQDPFSEDKSKNIKNIEENFNDLIYPPSAKALLKIGNYQEQADALNQSLQSSNYNTDCSKVMEKIKINMAHP